MARFTRVFFVLTAVAMSLSGMAVASASARHMHARPATKSLLTINITKTGTTVWGSVTIKPLNKTCKVAKCTYKVKIGTKLTLTEKPTNAATWPFQQWLSKGVSKGTGSTLKFKMGKKPVITAQYVLAGGTLTVNITSTGTVWGTVKIPNVGVCNQTSCTFKNVTLGAHLTATETPTDSSTWPFSGWSFNGTNEGTSTSFAFTMGSKDTLDANYVLAP